MSFRIKTILGIAIIEAVFLSILIINSLRIIETSHQKEISQTAKTLTSLFKAAISDAVLSMDIATLESLIDELLRSPQVVYVKVFDTTGLLAEGGDLEKAQNSLSRSVADGAPDNDFPVILHERTNIHFEDQVFGRVQIGIDTAQIGLTWTQARNESIRIAILEIILVAIASYFFGSYLTKQLGTLREAISKIKTGDYDFRLENYSDDELGQTAEAFSEMSAELKRTLDATESSSRRNQELASKLKQREVWLQAVNNSLVDGIITLDEMGNIRGLNDSACTIFGYAREELLGLNYSLVVLDEQQRRRIESIFQQGQSTAENQFNKYTSEWGYRRKGQRFPVDLIISTTEVNQRLVVILIYRDLTKEKLLQEKIELSNAIKDGMLESSLSAIVSIDEFGKIIEFNPAAEGMFGYSRDDILNKPMDEFLIPSPLRSAHRKGMQHYLKSGEGPVLNQRLQLSALKKNGDEFPIEIAISPSQIGEKHYFTAVIDDISERLAEAEKLKQATVTAEQANQAKSDFLASMSHEIRTPLNIVLGMVDLLQETSLSKYQLSYVENARAAGFNLMDLINNVLDLAKIEAGKLDVHFAKVNLAGLIEHVTKVFGFQALSTGLSLQSYISKTTPAHIDSDKNLIRQILTNLVGNAIKHTDSGGIFIAVDVIEQAAQFFVEIRVSDSGIGLTEVEQTQIFEEFSQGRFSQKTQGSTGLGLVISQKIANLLDGQIRVSSVLGQGSTFALQIPCQQPITKPQIMPKPSFKLVLCSGNEMLIDPIEKQFADWGFYVEVCKTPDELKGRFQRSKPTTVCLLVDTSSNSKDWFPALQNIRFAPGSRCVSLGEPENIPPTPQVPCIQLSLPLNRYQLLGLITGRYADYKKGRLDYINDYPDKQKDHLKVAENKLVIEKKSKTPSAKILVVDDSKANLVIAKSYLEMAGYLVDTADSGESAIEKLADQDDSDIDLILMDVRMPGINGIEATKKIRESGNKIPILALTAQALNEERELCIEAGMQDFLTKPIDRQHLIATVRQWLSNASTSLQAEDSESLRSDSSESVIRDATISPGDQAILVDHNALDALERDTSPAILIKMLKIYIKELYKRLTSINKDLNENNLNQAGVAAHALKSSSLTFGAKVLHLEAKAIEKACQENDLETAKEHLIVLEKQAIPTLEQFKKSYDLSESL